MSIQEILLLGNPVLYQKSELCVKDELSLISKIVNNLHDTLMEFRQKHGFGRAIAAPQIGEMKRIIYMHVEKSVVFINPLLTPESDERIILWDDCMSFPELLVKVKRFKSCKIEYYDLNFEKHEIRLSGDLSELVQHEYDHLDGILAVQRAVDNKSFAMASQRNNLKIS